MADARYGLAGAVAAWLTEAGEPRKSLANRSFSMKVMSPGPASPTGRAERMDTLPSPTNRPRTKAAKKRRVRLKEERRLKKHLSRVMPMLSRPKKK